MITTDFVTGSPCWLDLGSPDIDSSAAFYSAVLGWEFQAVQPGEFGMFRMDGKVTGAVGRLTEEGARPAWMIYFRTDDVEAATRATESAGGAVRVAPSDAGEWGRMAQLTDPQGGEFALWQPGETPGGLELVDAPGSLCWIELYTTDAAGAKAFYGELFGWLVVDSEMPGGGGTYTLIGPAGLGDDRTHGGMMELSADALPLTGGRPYWHPVFHVTDCDATVAKVTQSGGSVQMGPDTAPGVGRLALCRDSVGAEFVLLTPSPE